MCLQLLRTALFQNRRITSRLRIIQDHGFFEELEPINFFDGVCSGLNIVKDNECLPLCFEVSLCDDLDYGAVFGEELCQSFLELVNFDALLQVADLCSVQHPVSFMFWLLRSYTRVSDRGE